MSEITRVVLISCTQAKLDRPAPPSRLYTGVTWSTWRRHGPPSPPCGWHLFALSAEHGLVPACRQTIAPYDRKLDAARVAELAPLVARQLRPMVLEFDRRAERLPIEVVVVGGSLYQQLATEAGLPVVARIDGTADENGKAGIGILRQRLSRWAKWVYSSANATPYAEAAWPPQSAPSAHDGPWVA